MRNIGTIQTSKFKNNAISLVIPVGLDENITGYNVLAQVLKRGTRSLQTSSEISRHLQEMYGAIFDIGLSKVGAKLFVIFYVSFLDNRYTLYQEDLWDQAIALLEEVLYHPLLVDGQFRPEIVEQEIANHRLYIESVYDDKSHYSMERVMELGLHDVYRIPDHGTLEELEKVTNAELVALWEALKEKEAFCYATGHLEEEARILEKLERLPILKNGTEVLDPQEGSRREFNRETGNFFETSKVNQGKVSLLYNTNVTIFNGDYFALVLFNSIFGGGAHSKLFNKIREKHSLAYSIYSSFDKYAGVMTIGAGVDTGNFARVKSLIDLELENMIQGEFSDEELMVARTKVISTLKAMEDSMYNLSNYLIALRVFGLDITVEEVIENLMQVTKERIMAVAKNVEYIAGHYLGGEEQHGEL
ncbi:insulinase family protein [Proteiniclasticum sp. BAD-10]|uniref:Insulinase family protein n=1 Tax=Proteiniclasticum sediminis TaxID=2804028 RepID=A0A941CMP8_9CLOT|nr:insulinase family protein [Proteiniclasticum sediminis]MBR0575400.1 insulinase family protein [Proteiniclasticum sediminis]